MPFNPLPKTEFGSFKKISYMDLTPGKHIVRVLTEDPLVVDVHTIQKSYVKCLGADCPICKQNKDIIFRNPSDFRNVPGYLGKTRRIYINVLDITPVRVCPKEDCQHPNKKIGRSFPDACVKCGTFLKGVETMPLSKVVVLNMGTTLYDQFVSIERAVRDGDGNVIGLRNYDVVLTVVGTGAQRVTTAEETDPLASEPRGVPEDALFDVTKAYLNLNAEQINAFRAGKKLKEIFASSRGNSTEGLEEDAKDQIGDLEKMFTPPTDA